MTHLTFDQLILALLPAALSIAQAVLRIAVIVFVGAVCVRFIHLGLSRLARVIARAGRTDESVPGSSEKRAATLTGVVRTIAITAVWAIVAVVALAQVGLDVAPILAGAGIIGLAVGFGAQNLVRDLISGFFIVLEDQVRVGDVAVINGTGGQVDAISFRTIALRDETGTVHVFPNGSINTLANSTKGWSAYIVEIGVAYKEDTDRVVQVMQDVAEDLRSDPVFGPKMLQPIEMMGVDKFADSAVIIKARLKTVPIEQWNVGREYRRRLKKAFDLQGIDMPFPTRALSLRDFGNPVRVQMVNELAATGDRQSS